MKKTIMPTGRQQIPKRSYNTKRIRRNKSKLKAILCLTPIATSIFLGWLAYYKVVNAYESLLTNDLSAIIVEVVPEEEITIQEHVWKIMSEEYNIPLSEKATAMGFIDRCENPNWDPYAYNVNRPTSGCPRGSVDWGIWMINDCYQLPKFENKGELIKCAQDVYCSTRLAMQIYEEWGNSWNAWSCY